MMKKVFVGLAMILMLNFSCVVFATEEGSGAKGSSDIKSANDVSGGDNQGMENASELEIYLKPEDMHPNGVNMEIGIASFWLQVGAKLSGSGDVSGEISYQWYESKNNNSGNLTPIEGETGAIFVPEQRIGTTYYCVGVTANFGGEVTTKYTKLLEATFTPKVIDKIEIIGVEEPIEGREPSDNARQYTDYDLNDYFGYEITKVFWTPEDTSFKKDSKYTVNIEIEYWDNVEISENVQAKINSKDARLVKNGENTAVITLEFDANNKEMENAIQSGENGEKPKDNLKDTSNNNTSSSEEVETSTVVLLAITIILVIVALIMISKRK